MLTKRQRERLDASLADDPVRPDKQTGYKVRYPGDKPTNFRTLLTDQQVIDCRGAYEFGGATRAELVEKYGVTDAYMRALLSYATRSKLIPREYFSK